jgi:hypothetical protein
MIFPKTARSGKLCLFRGDAPMPSREFAVGDWVLYRKPKHSVSPGPRASEISPAPSGEFYTYIVEKFWIVREVLPDGRLRLGTRRGKSHLIDPSDPNLRRVSWWQRWIYVRRFREVETSTALQPPSGRQ